MKFKFLFLAFYAYFILSCKKESTDPTKYRLKSYSILSNQFNTSKVRDSVVMEYNDNKLIKATSYYKYDLNSIGPIKNIVFSNGQNRLNSAVFTKDNVSKPIILEYDNDNLLKKIEASTSTFNIRYNSLKKVSGLTYSFNNYIDFEIQDNNVISINRTGNMQKNEFDTSNNPFYYIPEDIKIILMSEFGDSIFINYYNGFSKNCVKNYNTEKKDFTLNYKFNKANLPIEALVFQNSTLNTTIKFYY